MKIRKLLVLLSVLFVILASAYIIDPNRKLTSACLAEKSRHTSEDFMLSSLNVTAISQDRNQLVWIGTSAGINVFNGHDYIQFFHDAGDSTALPDDYINCLHRDRHGRMWVGTQNGLARYVGGYRFKRYRLPSADENITGIYDAAAGDGVVAENRTASFAVGATGSVVPAGAKRRQCNEAAVTGDTSVLFKPQYIISTTYTDANRNLWIGFRNAGYQVLSDNIIAYRRANNNPLAHATATHDIVALASVGTHLLAGSTLRLRTYDSKSHASGDMAYSTLFGTSPADNLNMMNIVAHGTDGAWLVADRQIVSCRVEGGQLATVGKAYGSISGSRLMGCGTNIGDCLYAASSDGYIIRYRFGANGTDSIRVSSPWFDHETQLAPLADGRLLLYMRNMHLAVLNPATRTLMPLATNRVAGAGNIDPAFVRIDSRHNVWLGTKRYGLYRLDIKKRRIERMDFPADVHIQALLEDPKGQIWITTLKDAVCYQPQTGAVLMNSLVSSSQNQWNRQFFDNSICMSSDGNIVLGSSDGCIFIPSDMPADRQQSGMMSIYALDVKTAAGSVLSLNDDIRDNAHYTLAHDENDITLRFFYPNYARRSSLMFQYRLDGYDRTWHAPTYAGTAHYANLAPGDYEFSLRLVSSPDLPPVAVRHVRISVKAAPWQSAAAWLLYITCIGMAVYYVNSLYLRVRTNRLRLVQEQHEREREQRANAMNMSFFANISHEFRNPITLIAGPLIALRSDSTLPAAVQQSLNRVCISVNRMLRLIDQMLDFNQLETDALRLRVSRVDAAAELRVLVAAFEEPASVRGIRLDVDIADACCTMLLDTDKMEKIMSNLFTNALKHTPDNGLISISMRRRQATGGKTWLEVEVYNSGSHIADDRLHDVFKRYFQLTDANAQHKYGWGTGIGLYYVKRLVMLHHGTISVRNVEKGDAGATADAAGGVAFSFSVPMDDGSYSADEHASQPAHAMQIPVAVASGSNADAAAGGVCTPAAAANDRQRRPKILVVDDDVDVAAYIRHLFDADYAVDNRYSAEAALADLKDIRPDIILSDIIMGEMSGYEFCRMLKSDLMWSHIPVVLITAKSNIDEQISGLRLGAVAYVTKPFDPAYLTALVKAQLDNVATLRRRLGDSTTTAGIGDEMSEQDRRFMDELYAIMERRSAELELSVAAVCRDLLVSQSKFNYKLKQLTGDTPGTFFRKYKLNRAARMLREGRHSVSEIAVMTGFSTAAHFSVAFKKQFGVVPSEY